MLLLEGRARCKRDLISSLSVLLLVFCVVLLVSMVLLFLFFKSSQARLKRTGEMYASQWQTQDVEALKVERPAIPV